MKSITISLPLAAMAMAGLALTIHTTPAAPITVSSYVYGANPESQPQPTNFQGGSISDVGEVKLTDGQLATGSWNDFTNVGFRNDSDNGNPQPRVTFDLGGLYTVETVDVWTVSAFLTSNESVSISSSVDGVTFSAPLVVDPLSWSGGFANGNLRQASVNVSALPAGQYYQLDFLDPAQWMMINEIQFDGEAGGTDTTPPLLAPGDIVDDQDGGPVFQGTLVTYTVTFSDDMDDATVDAADFGNAGNATITIGTITETSLGVFTVEVTPTSTGTLELRVPVGATMTDDAGNPLDTSSAIVDDDSITVDPPDITAPTVAGTDIVDDQAGGPVNQKSLVTYTVTFSEDMDENTVDAADFGNAGTSTVSIGAITETAPGVFSIAVTPTDAGTLRLEIAAGASLADPSGNALDAASAITDDTTLTVENPFPDAIAVSSYVYGTNPESQPAAITHQDGSLADLVDFGGQFLEKLTDGQVATGGWKDFTHVGFRNDSDNGAPQPGVTFDLGGLYDVSTIDVFSNTDFAALDSVDISVSSDGTTFSAPISVPLVFSVVSGKLTQATIDVSGLPSAAHYRLDFFQDTQWAMINEVVFSSTGGDYADWAAKFAGADLGDPNADYDGDGLSNDDERLFGLDPTDPASVNPFSAPLDPAAGTFSLTRRDDALTGRFTTVETSNDLVMWTEDTGAVLTPGTPDADDIESVAVTLSPGLLSAPTLFVRVTQGDGIILAENFETDDGGFAMVDHSGGTGTLWAYGDPDSTGGDGGAVTTGNGGSTNCWGTDIGSPGTYLAGTDTSLVSPVIDLSSVPNAVLSFAQAIDILEPGDTLVVNVIDDDISGGISVLQSAVHTSTPDPDSMLANWGAVSSVAITGGQPVRIEWRFDGDGDGTYIGAYIDDVTVSKALP